MKGLTSMRIEKSCFNRDEIICLKQLGVNNLQDLVDLYLKGVFHKYKEGTNIPNFYAKLVIICKKLLSGDNSIYDANKQPEKFASGISFDYPFNIVQYIAKVLKSLDERFPQTNSRYSAFISSLNTLYHNDKNVINSVILNYMQDNDKSCPTKRISDDEIKCLNLRFNKLYTISSIAEVLGYTEEKVNRCISSGIKAIQRRLVYTVDVEDLGDASISYRLRRDLWKYAYIKTMPDLLNKSLVYLMRKGVPSDSLNELVNFLKIGNLKTINDLSDKARTVLKENGVENNKYLLVILDELITMKGMNSEILKEVFSLTTENFAVLSCKLKELV